MDPLELARQSLAEGAKIIPADRLTLPSHTESPLSDVVCWTIAIFIILALCFQLIKLILKFSYTNLVLLGFSLLLALLSASLLEDYFYRFFNGNTVYATVTESSSTGCKVNISVYFDIAQLKRLTQDLELELSPWYNCSSFYLPRISDVIPVNFLPEKPELTALGDGSSINFLYGLISAAALIAIWFLTMLSTVDSLLEEDKKIISINLNSPTPPSKKSKSITIKQYDLEKLDDLEEQEKQHQEKWLEEIYQDKILPLLTGYEKDRKSRHKECWKKGFIWPPLSLIFICLVYYLTYNFLPSFFENMGVFAVTITIAAPIVLFISAVSHAYSPLKDFKQRWNNLIVNTILDLFSDITYCKESIDYYADSYKGHGNFNIKSFTDMNIIPGSYDDDMFQISLNSAKAPVFDGGGSNNISLENFIEGSINNHQYSLVKAYISTSDNSETGANRYMTLFKGSLMAFKVQKRFKGNILITAKSSADDKQFCDFDEDYLTEVLSYTIVKTNHAVFEENYAIYAKNNDVTQLITSKFIDNFLSATKKYNKAKVAAAFYKGQFLLVINNESELFKEINADTEISETKQKVIDSLRVLNNINEMAKLL